MQAASHDAARPRPAGADASRRHLPARDGGREGEDVKPLLTFLAGVIVGVVAGVPVTVVLIYAMGHRNWQKPVMYSNQKG